MRGAATAPSLHEVLAEVAGMRAAPLSPKELDDARGSITRSLPGMFQTTDNTAMTVGWLYLYDQPLDYYTTLPDRLAALTPASVFEATRRVLDPQAMRVVAVGDRKHIEGPLRALALGEVRVLDAHGEPLTGPRRP